MEDHYSAPGSLLLHLGPGELVRELHCAVKFSQDRNWYRAVVTALEERMAEVFLLDFGTTSVVSASHLRRLEPHFASSLPAQAVRVRLGGLEPPGGRGWPEESAEVDIWWRKCATPLHSGIPGAGQAGL